MRRSRDFLRIRTRVDVNINRWDSKEKKYKGWYLHDRVHNIKTNTGVQFFALQCYAGNSGGSIGTNGTNFMALSNDATAPAVGDTTMAGELPNTNGLGRAQATVTGLGSAGVGGSITATITYTWTDTTASTSSIQKGGVFTAGPTGGTMGHEYQFTSTNLAVNDQIQTTLTITVS